VCVYKSYVHIQASDIHSYAKRNERWTTCGCTTTLIHKRGMRFSRAASTAISPPLEARSAGDYLVMLQIEGKVSGIHFFFFFYLCGYMSWTHSRSKQTGGAHDKEVSSSFIRAARLHYRIFLFQFAGALFYS